MDFVPHDQKEQKEMLKVIGINHIDELYQDIPENLLLTSLNLPKGLSEPDLLKDLEQIANKNKQYDASFLGAGCYYHYIPSLVDFVTSRSQFFSAYTPYQPEVSQGMLQAIYEFQTLITRLTDLDIANASMYDAASACAEACTMAHFITRKKKILIVEGLHPEYIATIKSYLWGRNLEYDIVAENDLEKALSDDLAGVIIQNPNFYGDIIDLKPIVDMVHLKTKKAKIIQVTSDPTVLGIIKSPGEYDIDIFVAEGVGMPPSFGGPNLGILATKEKFVRKMPGRLIGKTKEIKGEGEGFILTLQAREQHIRREKALSNICSNQSLCMLASLVYFISLGKTGLKQIALQNIQKAHYLKDKISKLSNYQILNQRPTYNEFVVKCPHPEKIQRLCEENNLLAPLDLRYYYPDKEGEMLICVTETVKKEHMDKFIAILEDSN